MADRLALKGWANYPLSPLSQSTLFKKYRMGIYLVLIAQIILVVTGGAVRLTGSGLGCPTWPDCFTGKISPKSHPAQGYHAWIEFGNRLLTGIDLAIILILLILTFVPRISRKIFVVVNADIDENKSLDTQSLLKKIKLYLGIEFLGFFAQAVVGGITVLTHLNPLVVSTHFLLSFYLIFIAHKAVRIIKPKEIFELNKITFNLAKILQLITLLVIIVGTIVTGTGPHAGDIQAKRYPFDPRIISWFHADIVIALIGLTIGLYLILLLTLNGSARKNLSGSVLLFITICISQAGIGYIQYFTGLPEVVVGAHLFGATLVWLSICDLSAQIALNPSANLTMG